MFSNTQLRRGNGLRGGPQAASPSSVAFRPKGWRDTFPARGLMKTLLPRTFGNGLVAVCVVGFCVVFALVGRAETKAGTTPQQQLRPLLQELDAAAGARDTDRFMAAYLHQPALIWLFNGVEIHGWEDLRAQQLKWWSGGKSDVVYSDRSAPEFTILSPDAVIVTEMKESTRTLPDGTIGKNQF